MGRVILSDFDGTILTIDTSVYVLDKFAQGNWRSLDDRFEKGEITFEECMRRQFAMVRVPEEVILNELERVISFRPNFDRLIDYCRTHRVPLAVVSGGLDFSIRHFLLKKDWLNLVEIYAPKAECTPDGIRFTFPKRYDEKSVNFKDDLVRHYKVQGRKVFYLGDGTGDLAAAKIADFSFAVKGSRLAELCRSANIPHKEIIDFQEVVEVIKE